MRIQWCLYNIALPSAILVTMIYWGVLYPMLTSAGYKVAIFMDLSVHAFNTILMMIEQYIGSVPTRIAHVYQPITYGIIYAIFSAIMYAVYDLVLYPYVLDWGNPITAASITGILIYYLVAQFVLYLIYRAQCICLSRRPTV